ncbi:MAG: Chromate resistance protein ChrB [Bacteroidota bacterium]
MEWLLFTAQLPASPSSLRVMVWRRMKAAGALSLQNGVWLLPRGKEQERLARELLARLQQQGASGQLFGVTALSPDGEKDLLRRFRGLRDEEYSELIERCEALVAELAKETRKRKFTFAELEENEDGVEKLEAWLGRISARDAVGGERAPEAARAMESARKMVEAFAERVYERERVRAKGASRK